MGKQLPLMVHVKLRARAVHFNVFGVYVRLRAHAEGRERAVDSGDGIHRARVVAVGNDHAVGGNKLRKAAERVLHRLKILEIVKMVGLHIQQHRNGRVEGQEAVVVFAGLHDNGVAIAHAVSGVEQRECPADHDGGVLFRRHEDVGTHGGRRRLTVRSGDTERIFIVAHKCAPRLRPLKNRDSQRTCRHDLRVFIVDGSRPNDKFIFRQNILGTMADVHTDTASTQLRNFLALLHIAARDGKSHPVQYLRQRRHGNAAYANQIALLSGLKKILKLTHAVLHSRFYHAIICPYRAFYKLFPKRNGGDLMAAAKDCQISAFSPNLRQAKASLV